ncbi:uncharacterized protein PG986_002367 [Apiospora aurea]|uniref:Uncharacterized protein n=1 Tax=Apiospora aurea TaxID=335848 RepID=A0ABR1QZH6_9PEZI
MPAPKKSSIPPLTPPKSTRQVTFAATAGRSASRTVVTNQPSQSHLPLLPPLSHSLAHCTRPGPAAQSNFQGPGLGLLSWPPVLASYRCVGYPFPTFLAANRLSRMVRFSDGPSLYPTTVSIGSPLPSLPSSRRPFRFVPLAASPHTHTHNRENQAAKLLLPSNLDSDGPRASPCPVLLPVPASAPRVLIPTQTRAEEEKKKKKKKWKNSDLLNAERRAHSRLTYVCNTLRLGPLNDPVKTLKLETRQWRLAHSSGPIYGTAPVSLAAFPSDNRELPTPIPSPASSLQFCFPARRRRDRQTASSSSSTSSSRQQTTGWKATGNAGQDDRSQPKTAPTVRLLVDLFPFHTSSTPLLSRAMITTSAH